MSNIKIQGEVSLDTSNADAALTRVTTGASKMSAAVGKSGKDAADSIGKIGDGGAASAAKVEASTRNMIGAIQRTTAALDAGSKSGAEYYESLAKQRGVDVSVLRPYLAQLDAVKIKQEEAAISAASMQSAYKAIGIGIGAGIVGFAAMINKTIEAADSMNDLSKTTGIAVEQLAGLKLAAQQSGGDLDGIAKSINKLSMNIGKDGEKFKQLGIDAKDPLEAFKQLSDIFSSIEDPQTRAALGAAALGKSWESAAPLLSEGSKSIGDMVTKGSELSGITKQLALDSDAFNDAIAEVSTGISGKFAGATAALLPLMNELAKSLSDTASEASSSPNSFSPLAETFRALILLGGNIAFTFKAVGTEIGGIAAQAAALATGDWRGALAIGDMMKADAENARKSFDEWEQRIVKVGTVAEETGKKIVKSMSVREFDNQIEEKAAILARAKALISKETEDKAQKTSIDSATKARERFVSAMEKEAATYGMTATQSKLYEASLLGIKGKQLDIVKSSLAKIESDKALTEASKRAAEGQRDIEKLYKSIADERKKSIASAESEADKNEELARTFGMTKTAIEEMQLARLEEQLAQRSNTAMTLDEIETLEKLIEAKKRSVAAISQVDTMSAAKKQFDDLAAESKKFTDGLYQGLSDALMRGFESGKGFFQTFWDSIKNLFKTTVLKMAVHGVVNGVTGAFTQGAASAAGSSLFGSGTTLLSAGKTLWDGFATAGGAAGYIGGGISSLGGLTGSATLSAYGSGMAGSLGGTLAGAGPTAIGSTTGIGSLAASGSGTTAAGSAFGAGATSASWIPIVGWIIAGMATADKLYKNGWDANNGTLSNTGKGLGSGTLALDKFQRGLGMSDSLSNIFSGQSTIAYLFGRKAPSVQSAGIQGELSSSGLAGNTYQNILEKGGVFRSDKRYQNTQALTADSSAFFKDTFNAMQTAAKGFGAALGLEATVIDGYKKSINVALTGDAAANDAAIAKVFGGIADEMATLLIPTIAELSLKGEAASATIVRLGSDLTNVNLTMKALGLAAYDLSLAGSKGAEGLIAAFGSIEQLQAVSASYYDNFYSEAEKLALSTSVVSAAFKAANIAMPETRDAFKTMVEEAQKIGDNKTVASLLNLSSAFAAVVPASNAAAIAIQAIADAASRAKAIAAEGYSLDTEMLQLQGNTQALRQRELALLDESNRARKQAIYDLQDKQAADAIAATEAQKAADAASQAASAQQQAAAQAQQASEQIRSAWQSITNTLFDEVARIRGLTAGNSAQSLASAQAQFSIANVQALSGDQEAAKLLPKLSQTLLAIAEQQSPTLEALNRIRASTAGSLENTANSFSRFGATAPAQQATQSAPATYQAQAIYQPINLPQVSTAAANDTLVSSLIVEVREMKTTVEKLVSPAIETERNTRKMKDNIQRVTHDGEEMQTRVLA